MLYLPNIGASSTRLSPSTYPPPSRLQAAAIKEAALLKLELEDAKAGLQRVRQQYDEAANTHAQELARYRVSCASCPHCNPASLNELHPFTRMHTPRRVDACPSTLRFLS